jgi:hypothetical protein
VTTMYRHLGMPDIATSGTQIRFSVPMEQPRGFEISDPVFQWAKRFDRSLELIGDRLLSWLRDPSALEDDAYITPSQATILRAMDLVGAIRRAVMDTVLPSGATGIEVNGVSIGGGGEIDIELIGGEIVEIYRVEADQSVKRLKFRDNILVDTFPLRPTNSRSVG